MQKKGNRNYRRGTANERRIISQLSKITVKDITYKSVGVRSAGSHSPIDCFIIFEDGMFWVQSKRTAEKFNIKRYISDIEKLAQLPNLENVTKLLWVYSKEDRCHYICTLGD